MKKGNTTLKDIAKELGISVGTVSKAIKDYPDISEETRWAVQKLAKDRNYRPNSMAVGLRKSRSFLIGVIVPEVVHHFFSSVISGIMKVVEREGYSLMLFQSSEKYEQEVKNLNIMLDSRVEGVLMSLANETTRYEHIAQLRDMGIPVVLFDKVSEQLTCSKVVINDVYGGYIATEHLIAQGCSRIVHLKGPDTAKNAFDRKAGYLQALAQAGIAADERYIITTPDVNFDSGYALTQQLLAEQLPFDGLFAGADAMAIGAMQALKEAGVNIPEQVAVIGFSDWQMSAVVEPPLSSVRQPGQEIGAAAAHILLSEMIAAKDDEDLAPRQVVLPIEVVKRRSSSRI